MAEKPWRVCGDYISKLPETRLTGLIVLPEGWKYESLADVYDLPVDVARQIF